MAKTSYKVGTTWQTITGISTRVAGVWRTVEAMYSRVSGVWEQVFQNVVVNLVDVSCDEESPGGATAKIIYYNAGHPSRPGEVWATESGILVDQYALLSGDGPVDPVSETGDYQVKWESNAGQDPNTSDTSAKSTWIALSGTSFIVGWTVGAADDRSGSVTVSIRKGTGPTLDTAIWDGSVLAAGKGK